MSHIIVFGDSITLGCWDSKGGWVQRIRARLDKKNGSLPGKPCVLVYNLGISGDTTAGKVKRFSFEIESRLDKEEGNIILFSGGDNDSSYILKTKKNRVPLPRFKRNVRRLIAMARKYSTRIAFTGPPPSNFSILDPIPWYTSEAYRETHVRRYNDALKKICAQEKIPFLNFYSKLNNSAYISSLEDGIHPLDKGHAMVEKIVWSFLKKKKWI